MERLGRFLLPLELPGEAKESLRGIYAGRLRLGLVFGSIMFGLAVLVDFHQPSGLFWKLTLAKVIGVALLTALYFAAAPGGSLSRFVLITYGAVIAATTCVGAMIYLTGGCKSPWVFGPGLVMITGCMVAPVPSRIPALYTALASLGYIIPGHVMAHEPLDPRMTLTHLFFYFGFICLSMASGSTQHQFWRDQYERIIKHKALSESLRRHERELMENNRELELQKNKAQEANRLQSEFLSNIGHELRTPLTSIIGFSGLIMKTDSRPPAEAEMISRINSQGKELLDRIENLMELSRLDSASVELSPEPIAIGAVLGQVADSLQTQISEAGHTVRVDCENRSLKVVFDYNRMVTVITHLLKNAIKFTPPGGLIETGCYRTDGHVEIYVRDNGVGVSRELQEAIFDRFRQGDGSSTRRHGGSGIGLSIVKSIVELHGGRIRVESEPGKGSEFVVTVPRKTEVREKTSP